MLSQQQMIGRFGKDVMREVWPKFLDFRSRNLKCLEVLLIFWPASDEAFSIRCKEFVLPRKFLFGYPTMVCEWVAGAIKLTRRPWGSGAFGDDKDTR